MITKSLAGLLLASLIATAGFAAPPTQDSVDRLMSALKIERTFDATIANLDQTIHRTVEQALPGQKLTPADEKVLAELRTQMHATISAQISWPKIKGLYEQAYSETFSQDEINGLIAFYTSPVGQIYAEKQPEITQRTAMLMQKGMMPILAQLRGSVRDAVDQIVTAHEAPPPAPAPALSAPSAPPAAPAAGK